MSVEDAILAILSTWPRKLSYLVQMLTPFLKKLVACQRQSLNVRRRIFNGLKTTRDRGVLLESCTILLKQLGLARRGLNTLEPLKLAIKTSIVSNIVVKLVDRDIAVNTTPR